MTTDKTKATAGRQVASDTDDRRANHTDRVEAAQHIREVSKLCFQSASEDAKLIATLDQNEKRSAGFHLLRALRGWLVHGQIARRIEGC